MAEGRKGEKSDPTREARIKTDHELFIEAYEKPTQIYRFLRSRHLLEPIFLQRNISYIKECREKKRRTSTRRKRLIKLNDLAKQTKEKKDIASEIKSDNQLKITFQALDCSKRRETAPDDESLPSDNKSMAVEVILYKFKQPSPEVLLTTPSSIPFDCVTLGRCLIPGTCERPSSSSSSSPSDRHSITIPGSVLSWIDGPLGMHVLAFRITPLTKDDHSSLLASPDKRHSRKRQQNGGLSAYTGPDVLHTTPNHVSSSVNGYLPDEGSEQLETDQLVGTKETRHLNKKAPGGKTLPSLAQESDGNNLVVSITCSPSDVPDNPSTPSSNNGRNGRTRQTEVQHLVDTDKPKGHPINNSVINSSLHLTRSAQLLPESESYPQKRLNSDLSPSSLPPSKRHCGSSDLSPLSPSQIHSSLQQQQQQKQEEEEEDKYYAELVAFDSRQECLLVDGEYELHLTKLASKKKVPELRANGLKTSSLFSECLASKKSYEDFVAEKASLKLSVEWSKGPPSPRIEDVCNTALDFAKLRENYEELIQSLSKSSDSSTATTSSSAVQQNKSDHPSSKTPPTAFNFLYNKNTLQQTELKTDCVCPWCGLNCEELYPLLKHMSLCHPRFLFTYSPIEGGASIDVRINRMYDTPDSSDLAEKDNSFKRKKQPTKCQPSTTLLVKKKTGARAAGNDLKEFMAVKQFARPPPTRTFYHTHSCLPMLSHEIDSDEEQVPKWLKMTSSKMVDEFVDVNYGEKQFMKMWNLFMMEHMSIADKQLPNFCLRFAHVRKQELEEKRLKYNFISHVIYMCDIGLVPPSTITEVNKALYSTRC